MLIASVWQLATRSEDSSLIPVLQVLSTGQSLNLIGGSVGRVVMITGIGFGVVVVGRVSGCVGCVVRTVVSGAFVTITGGGGLGGEVTTGRPGSMSRQIVGKNSRIFWENFSDSLKTLANEAVLGSPFLGYTGTTSKNVGITR